MTWLATIILVLGQIPAPASAAPAAAAPASTVPGAPGAYGWPVEAVRVTRRFEPPPEPWLPGHRGVDLAAATGAVVRAAGPGRVAYAGMVAGRGVVSILHPDGVRTTYEPVAATVVEGDVITRGAPIATLTPGHDGCPVEACLHWGARRGESYLDPLSLIRLGRIRLKPLNPAAVAARPPAVARPRTRRRPGRRSATARPSR